MLKELKKLLAECHFQGNIVRTLAQADAAYLLKRAHEEIEEVYREPLLEDADRRLILATRLITLARYKLCNPSSPSDTVMQVRKRKSKKESSQS